VARSVLDGDPVQTWTPLFVKVKGDLEPGPAGQLPAHVSPASAVYELDGK
jgi:hypothetical protein